MGVSVAQVALGKAALCLVVSRSLRPVVNSAFRPTKGSQSCKATWNRGLRIGQFSVTRVLPLLLLLISINWSTEGEEGTPRGLHLENELRKEQK